MPCRGPQRRTATTTRYGSTRDTWNYCASRRRHQKANSWESRDTETLSDSPLSASVVAENSYQPSSHYTLSGRHPSDTLATNDGTPRIWSHRLTQAELERMESLQWRRDTDAHVGNRWVHSSGIVLAPSWPIGTWALFDRHGVFLCAFRTLVEGAAGAWRALP